MTHAADRGRSLEDIEGARWGAPPEDASRLISEAYRLRKEPVDALAVEDLRLLIGQQIGLDVLVPIALEKLRQDPLVEGHIGEGDLLRAVLRVDGAFWENHRAGCQSFRSILDSLVDPPESVTKLIRDFRG